MTSPEWQKEKKVTKQAAQSIIILNGILSLSFIHIKLNFLKIAGVIGRRERATLPCLLCSICTPFKTWRSRGIVSIL